VVDDAPNRQENLDALLGNMAIHRGLLTHDQLRAALAEQGRDLRGGKTHPRPLGIILVGKGYISDEQLLELLEAQKLKTQELELSKKQDSLLGRILVQKSQVTQQQLNECLGIQAASLEDGEEEVPRLGALLIKKGYVTPSLIMHALALQQKTIMACEACSLRFNVQNYNPATPIPCPQCKLPLKPLPETDTSKKDGVAVSANEITATKKTPAAATPPAPPPTPAFAVSAEERARQEAMRQDAELRAKAEASRAKVAAEKLKAEAEEKARVEDENRRKAEQEAKAKADAEAKTKAENEARAKKKEADEKSRLEAIHLLAEKAKAEREAKEKTDREAKAKAEHEAKSKAEREAKEKADREAKAKAEHEAKSRSEREAKEKADREAKAKAEHESKAKAEREAEEKAAQEAQAKADAMAVQEASEKEDDETAPVQEALTEPLSPEAETARRAEDRAREEAEAMAHAVEERRRLKTIIGASPRAVETTTDSHVSAAEAQLAKNGAPKRKSRAPLLVAAVLLLCAAGGGYFYLKTQQDKLANEISQLLQAASGFMATGKYDDALETYTSVVAKDPENAQAKAGRETARNKIASDRKAAEDAAAKAKTEAEGRQKALEKRLAEEKEAAKNAAEKDRQEAETRIKAIQAELDKAAVAKRESEERARIETEARTKAEAESRAKTESEAKAKAEAEAARLVAQKARAEAEAQARAKAEEDKRAREDAEKRAKDAEKANAEQSLTTAVLFSDRGDYSAAYKELDKARKGGVDPVPVGRRIVQKELSGIFALEDRDAKVGGYKRILAQQGDYLTDPLRDTTLQQLLQLAPPAGMAFVEKNALGALEFKNLKDDSIMVYVPGGEFLMGVDGVDENEKPVRKVVVDGCFIDKTEVTVARFRKFVEETRYVTEAEKSGGADVWTDASWESKADASWKNPHFDLEDDQPVTCVSWNDVSAYCAWAGKRLPTEAEWEKAARGTDGRKFPWGNDPAKSDGGFRCNAGPGKADADGAGTVARVGSYPTGASPFGLLDMAGNVAEWVSDWYDEGYYKKGVNRNPRGPASGSFRVRRGGSWFSEPDRCRCTARIWSPPTDRNSITGFRGARDAQ
jgi:formylglycine-generating enzyme required for sulfatase activity